MMKKTLVLVVIFFLNFLVSFPASAQVDASSPIPAINPFCWTRKDCREIRNQYIVGIPSDAELDSGFVTGPSVAPCIGGEPGSDSEWGRCLPAGQTKTEISFGGQTRFSNIGDFILLMYRYLISVASILAVIVIIVSGVQWVTSGGNTDTIGSAKKRIGGAVIGLFIGYMSYFILNTVNPALVNLRLPQVWLAKPQSLIPQFCKDIPGTKEGEMQYVLYSSYAENDQTSPVDTNKIAPEDRERLYTYNSQFNEDTGNVFYCGNRLLPEGGGNQTCFGDVCPSRTGQRQMCGTHGLEDKTLYCVDGDLRIHYYVIENNFDLELAAEEFASKLPVLSSFFSKALLNNWLEPNNDYFWGVCELNSGKRYLANGGEGKKWDTYSATFLQKSPYREFLRYYNGLSDWENKGWDCRRGGTLVGYYMRVVTNLDVTNWEIFKDIFTDQVKYPNMSIGYDSRTGQAVFGTFVEDVIMFNKEPVNFIPIEKLKQGGVQLEVGLTLGKLVRMKGYSGQTPGTYSRVFEAGLNNEGFDFGDLFSNPGKSWQQRFIEAVQ